MGIIGWLASAGFCAIGVAAGLWGLTELNKMIVIWCIGVPGGCALVFAAGFEFQNFIPDATNSARPWIGVSQIDVAPVTVGSTLRASVQLINRGHSQATNVRAYLESILLEKGQPTPELLKSLLPSTTTPSVILPGDGLQMVAFRFDQYIFRSTDDVAKITSGTLTPWINLRVEYSDSTGGNYWLVFRSEFDRSLGVYRVDHTEMH